MKTAIFIDGGYLRVLVRQADLEYTPDYIETIAHSCLLEDEFLLRILYYDCAPYKGNPKLPVSGKPIDFTGSDEWIKVLSAKPQFAVRFSVLKFRGFVPKKIPLSTSTLSQVALVQFPGQTLARELLSHSDFQRQVEWPD
ncbi:MAG: hypothetical protein OXH82_01020 [Candidatus Dadabacteria bacterium]|nr:hypothetical protein [Candidatus Dadabacteria bacterium]MDE0662499.1 hypothetical protein [Candidatus Dadabacteria bacterium]